MSAPPSRTAAPVAPGIVDERANDQDPATSSIERLRCAVRRYLAGPFGTALALFGASWAGVIAEDNSSDLKFWLYRPSLDFSPEAAGFFTCLGAALWLSWYGQRTNDRERREQNQRRTAAENQLLEGSRNLGKTATELDRRTTEALQQSLDLTRRTEELHQLVQTLPPKDILTRWARHAEKLHEFRGEVAPLNPSDPLSASRIRLAIRGVLAGIIKVVRVYENAPGNVVMAANLMLFVPKDGLLSMPPEQREEIEGGLSFGKRGPSIHTLDGVLILIEPLSTRSDLKENAHDDKVKELVLPIPTERELADGRSRVLPGAPTAWATRRAHRFASQEEMLDWCHSIGAFTTETLNDLRTYLKSPTGREVASFLSLPLPDAPGTRTPVGVLNVHSDQPGLLRDRKPEDSLFVLLQPALSLLGSFLSALREAEAAERQVDA